MTLISWTGVPLIEVLLLQGLKLLSNFYLDLRMLRLSLLTFVSLALFSTQFRLD